MTQNVIVAQRVSNEGNQSNWQVAVRVPSGKMFARRTCSAAIKAMRYMFLLKARHGYEISKECLRMLKEEHRQNKAALESAPMQEESVMKHQIKASQIDIDQITMLLEEPGVNFVDIRVKDLQVIITIKWGDWKHDHLCCRHIMQSLGYTFVREEVIEEDGSDAYSAVHYYK